MSICFIHSSSITQSGGFGRAASAASLHDAHLGQAGMLALSEEAVSASIEASMHTPKASGDNRRELDDLVSENLIIGNHSNRCPLMLDTSYYLFVYIMLTFAFVSTSFGRHHIKGSHL